jgi:riboflavin synthase
MFTGIIEAVGVIDSISHGDQDRRMTIGIAELDLTDMKTGDSLAVSGVCLSLVNKRDEEVDVDISAETLRCTTLGNLREGSRVNLEKSLRLSDRLGGHLVSGHVDGVGTVAGMYPEGESMQMQIQAPRDLARYLCSKGSICVDGVSLTINIVEGSEFTINLIPHTRTVTTLGALQRGDRVNLEVDMIARYLERLHMVTGRV